MWDEAVQVNPALFDGPVVACAGLERTGPRVLRPSWVRVTYRRYALRRVPGAAALVVASWADVITGTHKFPDSDALKVNPAGSHAPTPTRPARMAPDSRCPGQRRMRRGATRQGDA